METARERGRNKPREIERESFGRRPLHMAS